VIRSERIKRMAERNSFVRWREGDFSTVSSSVARAFACAPRADFVVYTLQCGSSQGKSASRLSKRRRRRTFPVSFPSVFVGSSEAGLRQAREIQSQLADAAEVELWNDDVFALSSGTLESLMQALNRFDFAVFVLSPDDVILKDGQQQFSARDNVLIELGLFMGRLGRERTFLVCSKDDNLRVPSDLAGITFATYPEPLDQFPLASAIGPACHKIRKTIEAQGKAVEVHRLKNEINRQGVDIQMMKAALRGIVTRFEIDYLRRLGRDEPWNCRFDPDTYVRLKRLDDMGFVLPTLKDGGRRLVRIQKLFGDENIPVDQRKWFDMKEYVEITADGKNYVALYEAVSRGT
jgi:predicted nucleotide-binding protein